MDLLQIQMKALGLPIPEKEYRFHATRRWKTDYFFPNVVSGRPLAVEIEGGIWIKGKSGRGGAHSLPSNIIRDMEKSNAMSIMGIALLRFTPTQVQNGEAAMKIKEWFDARVTI